MIKMERLLRSISQQTIWIVLWKSVLHVERYEFDTPGIDAHEVITKKDCEEVIS